MNANNSGSSRRLALACGFVATMVLALSVSAEPGLKSSSQTKVNNAKAKAWTMSDGNKDGYQKQNEKTMVNIGSKRAGTCNVNVGTVQPGQKAPKEIVVTTKEVINVCK